MLVYLEKNSNKKVPSMENNNYKDRLVDLSNVRINLKSKK